MFRGQFPHTIDTKGRISLPSRFRDVLGRVDGAEDTRFILTPAPFDPCIHLHSMKAWEEFEEKIAALPALDPHVVRFRRIYVSAAVECELDKAGRVLVPPALRERANLDRDCLWAGMGKSAELWSRDAWEKSLALSPEDEAAFKQAVMEQIRI